ncbi:complex I intermediate-associated protein 30-domain-containing protein [Mycena maculata]|uniref:Complex I intermediate-associated protein 30-domain-containing protein n=1 Tax=Mycena maculata TaxID=230809 RepID=A0AAD7NFQ2_9AGAR|nr:complex I intermediate-associated protein 30-domain-containing protein [Mycena maculata]
MSSQWSTFWRRTRNALQDQTRRIIRMEGADLPNRGPRLLFGFNTPIEVSEVITGCDADVGGLSTVNFTLDTTSESERIGRPTAKFHGHMRLDVRPEMVGRINSGYAGFKTPVRSTLFGKITDNVYFHDYLALRVRAAGDPVLHKSYFVNVQTVDQMSGVTVWQQQLNIRREDNDWETVYLPFSDFSAFTIGEASAYPEPIDRENILTIGVSVLGGKHHASGPYELGVDSIWVANEGDLEEDSPGPNEYTAPAQPDLYPTQKTP